MAQLVEQLICNQLAATRSILKTNINLSFSSIYFILQSALVSMVSLIKMICAVGFFSAIYQFEGVNFDQESGSMMKKASLKLQIQRIEELFS